MVEREAIDPLGGRVDVVHGPTVKAPVEPIGDRGAGDDRSDPQIGVEPIERPRCVPVVDCHGSRPESSSRIDLPVIHAGCLVLRLDRRDELHPPCIRIDGDEAVAHGSDQPARRPQRDRADHPADRKDLVLTGPRVCSMDGLAHDVHPPQHTAVCVPNRTLAKAGGGIHDELRAQAGHGWSWLARELTHLAGTSRSL